MSDRIGVVQSTSSVAFFGIDIMGDWWAMMAVVVRVKAMSLIIKLLYVCRPAHVF